MKKKIVPMLVMLFALLFTINVKADDDWVYSTIQKSENSGELYNATPTIIKKYDTVSIKIVVKNTEGLKLSSGSSTIWWDKEAFELVETNGKYYKLLDDSIKYFRSDLEEENEIYLGYEWDEAVSSSDNLEIAELTFMVKSNAKDGIYQIKQEYDYDGITYYEDNEYEEKYAIDKVLRYQVGKLKLTSAYTEDSVDNNSYVIGSHLFTRTGSDEYDGILTTEYIMLASKTIESDRKDDMIIYAKNARGNWINAITNESIIPPEEFAITYVDMKANYTENGIYFDDEYETIVRIVQISDKKALVAIENDNERLKGVASVNGKTVTLNVSGTSYKINIADDEISIETSDSLLSNKRVPKKANYTVNDYYDDTYGTSARHYLKSDQSGKYTLGNYELYVNRISDTIARICLKEKDENSCSVNDIVIGSNVVNNIEATPTYEFEINGQEYSINYSNSQMTIGSSNDEADYVGTYTKDDTLTMENVFDLWESEASKYKIIFVTNEDNNISDYEWIDGGISLNALNADTYYHDILNPTREDYHFVEWQLNGQKYNLDTIITGPMTLVAKWKYEVLTPVITLARDTNNYYLNNLIIDNLSNYCTIEECNTNNINELKINGYEVYEKDGDNYNLLEATDSIDSYSFYSSPNTKKTYVIKTYAIINNNVKVYSEYSNEIEIDARISDPVIEFTQTANANVDYASYENGVYSYKIAVNNLDDFVYMAENHTYKIEEFDLFKKVNNAYIYVKSIQPGDLIEIDVPEDSLEHYYVRAYTYDSNSGSRAESNLSNELVANQKYTVTFNSNGGTPVANQTIMKGSLAAEPVDPERENYTFVEWQLNGETYDFDTPITSDITLVAAWNENPKQCYHEGENYEWTNNPTDGWELVDGVTIETDCHAPVQPACYTNGENYSWTNAPEDGWELVDGVTESDNCHGS